MDMGLLSNRPGQVQSGSNGILRPGLSRMDGRPCEFSQADHLPSRRPEEERLISNVTVFDFETMRGLPNE